MTEPEREVRAAAPAPDAARRHGAPDDTSGSELAAFFGLALAIAWGSLFLGAGLAAAGTRALHPLLDLVASFAPTIAALVVAARTGALAALLASLGRWRVHPGWYAGALLGPPALVVLAVVLDPQASLLRTGGWALLLPFALRYVLLGGGLGEEVGWRGFALPRLARRTGWLRASLLIGLVWLLWHLPSVLAGGPVAALRLALGLVPLSVILAWTYRGSGASLVPPVLLHGMVNASTELSGVIAADVGPLGQVYWTSLLWGAAVPAAFALRRRPPPLGDAPDAR